MARMTAAAMAMLVGCSPAASQDWAPPALGDSVFGADAVVIGRIVSVTSPTPAADSAQTEQGTRKATVEIDVQEVLKGDVATRITVEELDLGDPIGMTSPLEPLGHPLEGAHLLLMLKVTPCEGIYHAAMRHRIADDHVRQLLIESRFAETTPLPQVRAIVHELALVQRALAAAEGAAPPGLAAAACRVALLSRHGEVVWFACNQARQRDLYPAIARELRIAADRFAETTPTGRRVRQCLPQAETGE